MRKVAEVAAQWVGRNFRAGQTEQCMAFVRHVLREAGADLANRMTKSAVDGLWTGPELANSLAGRDLGQLGKPAPAELPPGAILFWENTYGNWSKGTITHVGIYVGNNEFVHRPTASRPVEKAAMVGVWAEKYRCALWDYAPAEPEPQVNRRRWKLFAKPGRMVLVCNQDCQIKAGQELELEFLSFEGVER